MLTKVFAIWLITSNITMMQTIIAKDKTPTCKISFVGDTYVFIQKHTCDEVAARLMKDVDKK